MLLFNQQQISHLNPKERKKMKNSSKRAISHNMRLFVHETIIPNYFYHNYFVCLTSFPRHEILFHKTASKYVRIKTPRASPLKDDL